MLSVAEVLAPADAEPARSGAMILVTTFASLRFGEVTALQRTDLDLSSGLVRGRRALVEVRGRGLVLDPPKSRAGVRTVALPHPVFDALRDHVAAFVNRAPTALVFTSPTGAPIRRGASTSSCGGRTPCRSSG